MPSRPAKACKVLGCAAFDPSPIHGPAAERAVYERVRGSAHARGYDHEWRAFVVRYFGTLWALRVPRAGLCGCRHPTAPATRDSICAREHVPQLAQLVDHIVPMTGRDDPRRFDVSNLQGLCDRCHNQKRQREAEATKRRQ